MKRALWTFADIGEMKKLGLTADQVIGVLTIAEGAVARGAAPSKGALRARRYRERKRVGKRT